MPKDWRVVGAVVAILAAVGLAIWFIRPDPPPCQTSEYSRLVGVGVDVQLEQLKALQGKLGLTDAQVKGFDVLLRDYAAKYDAACQDVTAKLITVPQYQCQRQKMDQSLDAARRMQQAVEAATTSSNPEVQRAVLEQAGADLRSSAQAGYTNGCIASIEVTPLQLAFKGQQTLQAFKLLNLSANPLTFGVTNYPDGFAPDPDSGSIAAGESRNVLIRRTLDPVPQTRPLQANIKISYHRDITVEFVLDDQNAQLWPSIGKAFDSTTPTVVDALAVIDKTLPTDIKPTDASRYVLAATALTAAGAYAEATAALDHAVTVDASLGRQPSTVRLAALSTDQTAAGGALYARLRKDPSIVAVEFPKEPAAGATNVGAVRLTSPVKANDSVLSPGRYDLFLTPETQARIEGISGAAQWVEFRQDGTVKGRELVAVVPEGIDTKRFLPLREGTPEVGLLRGGEFYRLAMKRRSKEFLVHLPLASASN